jgi:transcription initiation factor IIE alpha subunit
MKPTTLLTAMRLAGRRKGATANELAELVGCPLRTARHTLRLLARDGLMVAEVPARKGKARGDWRTVYRNAEGRILRRKGGRVR